MEFEGFDLENPCQVQKSEEERRLERLQTGYITIQQYSMHENRIIKQEDQIKKKQRKMLQKIMQQTNHMSNKMQQDQRRSYHNFGNDQYRYMNNNQNYQYQSNQLNEQSYYNNFHHKSHMNNENNEENSSNLNICNQYPEKQFQNYDQPQDYMQEEEEWEEEDEEESQFLLEDEILLDLDFFNKKGEENIDKCIMEKVSIWNDVRPVIQVIAKQNRIEIIYDNGHRLLKDFRFLIKKLEKYKDNQDAKFASQLLQQHQKNIELEEDLFARIVKYYDHEMNNLYEMVAKNYEKSKQIAYKIIDSRDETQLFAFSIRKLNLDDGIQHISGPFGYSKPLVDIFGGDMGTYVRFIMRKGVIEHFNRQSHFIIFLMKLRIIDKTDLTVVTLDNIKIPISVSLERHSLSKIQVMPDCYQEDYLKIYNIFIKDEILKQLQDMRRSKENFQNTIQGLEDFEYFMQSQIFYDKFYKKQRHSSDSAKMCRYRYLDRSQTSRYQGKSQRKFCEEYLRNFQGQFKRKKIYKNSNSQEQQQKEGKNSLESQANLKNLQFMHGLYLDDDIIDLKENGNNACDSQVDIQIDSQTVKQEETDPELSNSKQNKQNINILQNINSSSSQKQIQDASIKNCIEQDENISVDDKIKKDSSKLKRPIRKRNTSSQSANNLKKQQKKSDIGDQKNIFSSKENNL
ncbi:hypothetical protein ABPG74_018302 [Tetrahymena malaccensis]